MTEYKSKRDKRVSVQTGFTLVEVMVVITIAVILLAVASPFLVQMPANSRLQRAAQGLVSVFQQARSEAVRSNQIIYVCALGLDAAGAINGCSHDAIHWNWNHGVLMSSADFTVAGATYDSSKTISHVKFNDDITVSFVNADGSVNSDGSNKQISFFPNGRTKAAKTIRFKFTSNANQYCRGLVLDASGRASFCQKGDTACVNICN